MQLTEATETVIAVEIYSMLGERILQTQISGQQQYEFDLITRPGGVYLVRVVRGDEAGVEKIIKQRGNGVTEWWNVGVLECWSNGIRNLTEFFKSVKISSISSISVPVF